MLYAAAGALTLPLAPGAPAAEGRRPVVLFSHGLAGNRLVYSGLCAGLASRGYVVAVMEHHDGSASMAAHAGDGAGWRPYEGLGDDAEQHRKLEHRAAEVLGLRRLLGALARGERPAGLSVADAGGSRSPSAAPAFAAAMDMGAVVLAGHSFGGATAILLASRGEPCAAVLALDPWHGRAAARTHAARCCRWLLPPPPIRDWLLPSPPPAAVLTLFAWGPLKHPRAQVGGAAAGLRGARRLGAGRVGAAARAAVPGVDDADAARRSPALRRPAAGTRAGVGRRRRRRRVRRARALHPRELRRHPGGAAARPAPALGAQPPQGAGGRVGRRDAGGGHRRVGRLPARGCARGGHNRAQEGVQGRGGGRGGRGAARWRRRRRCPARDIAGIDSGAGAAGLRDCAL